MHSRSLFSLLAFAFVSMTVASEAHNVPHGDLNPRKVDFADAKLHRYSLRQARRHLRRGSKRQLPTSDTGGSLDGSGGSTGSGASPLSVVMNAVQPQSGVTGSLDTTTGQQGTDTSPDSTSNGGNGGSTGTGNPGTANPGTANPGTGNPGTGNPGTGNPGTVNPGTVNPGTGNPGTVNPGTGNPGTANPGTSNPGSGNTGGGQTTPGGCAHEDGPSSGNPGWTCSSGGSGSQPSSRDLTSLRFMKRQSGSGYLATVNEYRSKFCLPAMTSDPALEQSAATQGADSASKGAMTETPPSGQGTVMAEGLGSDFESSMLAWVCEVHTTNLDGCTCKKIYDNGFQWTERGHYDFLVGAQASQFSSIGCSYNEAMGGLWTCALGMS